jgi:hypothetical protein
MAKEIKKSYRVGGGPQPWINLVVGGRMDLKAVCALDCVIVPDIDYGHNIHHSLTPKITKMAPSTTDPNILEVFYGDECLIPFRCGDKICGMYHNVIRFRKKPVFDK